MRMFWQLLVPGINFKYLVLFIFTYMYDTFVKTACFFQPEERREAKKLVAKPIVANNNFLMRYDLKKYTRSSSSKGNQSCSPPQKNRLSVMSIGDLRKGSDAQMRNSDRFDQKELMVMSRKSSKSKHQPSTKKEQLKPITLKEMAIHRRTFSAHDTKSKSQIRLEEPLNIPNKAQKLQTLATPIQQTKQKGRTDQSHFDIYAEKLANPKSKQKNRYFFSIPIAQISNETESIQSSAKMSNYNGQRLPTILQDLKNTQEFHAKARSFLKSRAQQNMVNKLFRD